MTTYITTFDLPTLTRHAVGFDRMFNELNRTFTNSKNDNYPPFNNFLNQANGEFN